MADPSIAKKEINDDWKRRRTRTFSLIVFHYFTMGFRFTMIQSTLWSYLHKELNLTHPALYYGLTCCGYFLIIFLTGVPVSAWFDASRRLRLSTFVLTSLTLIGNLFFFVPNKYLTVSGSLLMGVAYIQLSIFNSELLRVYPDEELQGKYKYTLVAYGVGDCLGPVCAKSLENVDFSLLGVKVTTGNSICMVLTAITFVRLIITPIFVYDLSKIFDLKAFLQKEVDEDKNIKKRLNLQGLKKIANKDTLLLTIHQFYSGFWTYLLPRMLPLIIETMNTTKTVLDVCFFVSGIFMSVMAFILSKTKSSMTNVYHLGVLNIIIIFAVQILVLVLKVVRLHHIVSLILLVLFCIGYSTIWATEMIYIPITLGRIASSSIQTSVEVARWNIILLAAMVASFVSVYVHDNYVYFLPGSVCLLVMIALGMFLRRHSLSEPVEKSPADETCEEKCVLLGSKDEEDDKW